MNEPFDVKGKLNQNQNRNEISSETTLGALRHKHEQDLLREKISGLQEYSKKSKSLEEEIQKMRLEDAERLNYEKQKLEEKFISMQKRYNLSNAQVQLKLTRAFYQESRRLNLEARKEEIKSFNESLTDMRKNKKKFMEDYYKAVRDEEDSLSKEINALEEEQNKTRSKNKKKELADEIKKKKDQLNQLKKLELTNIKDVKKKEKEERKKAFAGLVDEAGSRTEAWRIRADLDEDGGDIGAQIMSKVSLLWKSESKNTAAEVSKAIKSVLQSYIEDYSQYQGKVNARLQGSGQTWNNGGVGEKLQTAVGATPFVKLSKLLENASQAVEAGIAYNIEQRAFLETIKDDIATTFDAFNANLLRIIRLQQSDSTAARLGLEADLTQLFNSYFSDTSYLSDAFDTVSANLTEAVAQMGAEEGVAFEYQVQKWLGSLYSVGFSDSAIGNIATALGQLGSGDVSGLAGNSQMQNLLVMAASRAGLSYADMLTRGITASETNTLLNSMVQYLQEIAESDNKVVKSQYSQIFGLTAADLVAVNNLGDTAISLAQDSLNYSGAVNELYNQMDQLYSRMSVGELTGNMIDNVKYSIASGIADNPFTYALWEITDMIEGLSGGINMITPYVMGTGVDIGTTLTNLMRLGVVGAGALGNIGTIVNGISNSVSPTSILTNLGITTSASQITRGRGLGRGARLSQQVSASNMVGNTSGEDYTDSVTAQAQAEGDAAIQAQKDKSTDLTLNNIHEYLVGVFDNKITAITKMLASMSGYKVEGSQWGSFDGDIMSNYSATQVKITSTGETNMATQNAENMKTIATNVSGIYELLRNGLSVTVSNYGLSSNIPSSNTGSGSAPMQ